VGVGGASVEVVGVRQWGGRWSVGGASVEVGGASGSVGEHRGVSVERRGASVERRWTVGGRSVLSGLTTPLTNPPTRGSGSVCTSPIYSLINIFNFVKNIT